MEPRSIKVPWTITFILNFIFLIGSLLLMVMAVVAAVNPPQSDISPKRVNEYPQYLLTICLLALFAWCLFSLHFLGVIATAIRNSFLLSVFILCQIAQLVAQFVMIAFTLTVRTRLHSRLEETWRGLKKCNELTPCDPVKRFQNSETLLIAFFSVCTVLQLALLIASSVLCERMSYAESLNAQKQREKEEDEDILFPHDQQTQTDPFPGTMPSQA
ncbi:unnamed protein product, partial [Mesorhabditis belari]|uniref:Uncharacterized protein n=1 Tax=Mesorhabditis belari TaxID=2138241 RepID=A0AAF3FHQ0_9BILA